MDIHQQREFERLRNPPAPPTSTPPPSSPKEHTCLPNVDFNLGDFDENGDTDNEVMPDFNDHTAATVMNTATDFDTEMQQFILPELEPEPDPEPVEAQPELPPTSNPPQDQIPSPSEQEKTAEWKSLHQLTVYRNHAKEIEDSVIKEKGIKIKERQKA